MFSRVVVLVLFMAGFCHALNPIEMYKAGGWVMHPILGLSVIALYITVERLLVIVLQKLKLKPTEFVKTLEESVKNNNGDKNAIVAEMEALAQKKGGLVASILGTTLAKYKDGVAKGLNVVDLKQWMLQGTETKASSEIPALETHLGAIAVISNIATLLGLLGTVWGLIESFMSIANSPGGIKADEMAGGISVALITTAGGLLVAIPSLVLFNWIKSMIENYVLQIEETVTILIDALTA